MTGQHSFRKPARVIVVNQLATPVKEGGLNFKRNMAELSSPKTGSISHRIKQAMLVKLAHQIKGHATFLLESWT